jgi:hypothetical protein
MVTDETCTQFCTAGYSDTNGGAGAEYTCSAGTFAGTVLTCTPDDCTAVIADNNGPGFGTECDALETDSTCTQFCTAGYSDNNGGAGQAYTCAAGVFAGTLLECTPDDCSADVLANNAEGFGSECDDMVTDETCTQFCTAGYDDGLSGAGAEYTCAAGTFAATSSMLTCTPIDCYAHVLWNNGPGYGTECDALVTDSTCTQFCTAGYSDDNGGAGRAYTCVAGVLGGTLITCTPDDCSADVDATHADLGYGTECDDMVTDETCTQFCTAGYSDTNGGAGAEYTCSAGY